MNEPFGAQIPRRLASRLAAALLGLLATSAGAQNQPNSSVDIAYVEPSSAVYRPIYDRLQRRRVLEELREFLAPLRLLQKVLVEIRECNKESEPYQPGGPVTICYEYVHALEKFAERIPAGEKTRRGVAREDAIVGAFVQVVLNGMAHAVFEVLQVPVWGREEDAADKLAGYLMLQFGTETARRLLNGAAFFFEASDRTWTGSDFADTAGTDAQRFYNYLCIAYGGDAKAFFDFVQAGGGGGRQSGQPAEFRIDVLPQRRAERCGDEYTDLKFAFNQTIMPSVDQDLLDQVVKRQDWLRPDDGK